MEVSGFQFGKLQYLALDADLFGDFVLRGFEQVVEAPEHDDVAQAVVGDAPDEADEAVVGGVVYGVESTVGAARGAGPRVRALWARAWFWGEKTYFEVSKPRYEILNFDGLPLRTHRLVVVRPG